MPLVLVKNRKSGVGSRELGVGSWELGVGVGAQCLRPRELGVEESRIIPYSLSPSPLFPVP
ncbi:AraC family transcriptional regulator [Spirulina subsalsa]|uniref:AraC family transcriptional regulator n=1 Tax=Spirulina subsalsa TaxID=54311 RepID=UPI0002E67251|nr:AraC family transcriptional regulator [Spirulina subsalsa]